MTRLDHDANVTPWVLAADDAGATVRFLDIDPADCTLRLDLLPTLLNERTKLVAVGLASNAVGTVNPVREVVAAARRVGALVFVDAVHAVPHRPVDVVALGADFLACSPYKFFGPHLGVLWGRRDLLERLPAYKVRPGPGFRPRPVDDGHPELRGDRRHARGGGLPREPRERGRPARRARHRPTRRSGRTKPRSRRSSSTGSRDSPRGGCGGSPIPARIGDRVPTFGLTHRTRPAAEVASALGAQGLFVWSGHFYAQGLIERLGLAPAGMLRIGFLHYNTAEEVARTLDALAAVGD